MCGEQLANYPTKIIMFVVKHQIWCTLSYNQCWAVTSYCNLATVIILLFAVTSGVTNY